MAADSWLEEELAELDEAEKFIQQTMSEFVPSAYTSSETQIKRAAEPASSSKVTNSIPKYPAEVDKLTNQLIVDLESGKKKNNDQYNLPPPPDIDDFIAYKREDNDRRRTNLPPSPYSVPPPPVQAKHPPSAAMSKAPPPVLPKPSRSTPFQVKTGVGSVTMQLNNPRSPSATKPNSYSVPPPPPPATNQSHSQSAVSSFPPPPPSDLTSDLPLPPPPTATTQQSPARGIPKGIEKNSVDELDFLTNNLLLNMENPKEEDFYGYCEKCGGVVEGENVGCNALDKIYHISCFICATCGTKLHGDPFYASEKKPYCESCYLASLETCTVCSEMITERILRATGKPFHPACFKCSVCAKSLEGIPFTADDSNNVYCVEDYHLKFAFRCTVCKKPILPEPGKNEALRIIAMDKDFHRECYKCEDCGVQFSSEEKCYPIDGHIYCVNCSTERLQRISA